MSSSILDHFISRSQRHRSSVCLAGFKTSSPTCQSKTSGTTGTLGKHWEHWWTAVRQVTCAAPEPPCDCCWCQVVVAHCRCDVGRTVSGLGDLGPAEKGGERLRSHAAGRRLAGHPAGWCLLSPHWLIALTRSDAAASWQVLETYRLCVAQQKLVLIRL